MKKFISIALVLMMLVTCFGTLSVSAGATFTKEGNVINAYVKDGGTGDGTSESNPSASVATVLTDIQAQVGEDEAVDIVINLLGTTTFARNTWLQGGFNAGTTVTVVGKNQTETVVLTGSSDAASFLYCQVATTFANVNFKAVTGGVVLVTANGTLTMGTEGKPVSKDAASKELHIAGGMGSKVYSNVTLNSGTYDTVYATNVTPSNGTTKTNNAVLTVNSGVTVKTLTTACAPTINGTCTHIVDGDVNVVINSAKIEKLTFVDVNPGRIWYLYERANLLQINGKTTVTITGNADVTFAAATFNGHIDSTFFSVNDTAPTSGKGVQYKGGLVVDTTEYTGTNAVAMTDQLADVAVANVAVTKYTDGHIDTVFAQKSTATNDAMRFVIGLKEYNGVAATVKIVAKNGDTEVTTFNHNIKYVYSSVLADGVNGVDEITAESKGVNYLMAVTLKGIPTAGVTSFEVTPYINGVAGATHTFAYN